MTATSRRRDDLIATFHCGHAERVIRAVRRRVDRVRDEIIEDACQTAWGTLLRRSDITLDTRGLSTVAVHEPCGSARSRASNRPAPSPPRRISTRSEAYSPSRATPIVAGPTSTRWTGSSTTPACRPIRALKSREREALYLQGLGYSYSEIMRLTGAISPL